MPYLICDAQAGVTSYKLTGPAWVPMTVTAQLDGSLKVDVTNAIVGANALTVVAVITDPLWGELVSAAVPFSFTKPSAPVGAGNLKLSV